MESEPAPRASEPRAAAQPYTDWAPPLFWLPFPMAAVVGPDATDLAFGAGACLYGGSLLDTATWTGAGGWLFGADQPWLSLSASKSFGPLTVGLDGGLSYAYTREYDEEETMLLSLTFSVFREASLDRFRSLAVNVGLEHSGVVESTRPFTFSEALDGEWRSSLSVPFGADFAWGIDGAEIDPTSLVGVKASLQATAFLPVLSLDEPQGEADLRAEASFIPLAHIGVRLGLKAAQDVGPERSSYTETYALPRGFSTERERRLAGAALVSLDVRSPLGLLDQPLPLGFAVTEIGCGAHVEATADYGLAPLALDPIPTLYLGAEVTVNLCFNSWEWPLGIGVSAAMNVTDPGSFDPSRDLGLYVFMGYDSFTSASLSRRARPQTGD